MENFLHQVHPSQLDANRSVMQEKLTSPTHFRCDVLLAMDSVMLTRRPQNALSLDVAGAN